MLCVRVVGVGDANQASHSSLDSVEPVAWPAMQMRDRNDQDFGFQDLVSNTVREPARLTTTAVLSVRMPSVRKLSNALKGTQHFQ
jgi:hypothetical protein